MHTGELIHLTVLLDGLLKRSIFMLSAPMVSTSMALLAVVVIAANYCNNSVPGRLIAFDKDPYAIANAETIQDPRFHIVHDSFATMAEFASIGCFTG